MDKIIIALLGAAAVIVQQIFRDDDKKIFVTGMNDFMNNDESKIQRRTLLCQQM